MMAMYQNFEQCAETFARCGNLGKVWKPWLT